MRADSYHAIRLMDLALTGWVATWVHSQELQQRMLDHVAHKQAQLLFAVLTEWRWQAERLRRKRARMDM